MYIIIKLHNTTYVVVFLKMDSGLDIKKKNSKIISVSGARQRKWREKEGREKKSIFFLQTFIEKAVR